MRFDEWVIRRFHNMAPAKGRAEYAWMRTVCFRGVIRNSLNGSEVLVNHVAFAGLIRFKLRAA